MKHLKRIPYFTVITLLLFSCSKHHDDPANTTNPTNPSTDCKLSKISYSLQVGNLEELNVTYSGNNISELTATSASPVIGKALYFYDAGNHLVRKVLYDNSQQFLDSKTYSSSDFQYGREEVDSTFYSGSVHFHRLVDYEINQDLVNGQLTNFRLFDIVYRDDLDHMNLFTVETPTWTGDDVTTLTRADELHTVQCAETITYDVTKENKFTQAFPEFLWQDLFNDYLSSRMTPCFYFSKHMISSVTSDCSGDLVGNFTYTYNTHGLIKEIILDGRTIFTFAYTCD